MPHHRRCSPAIAASAFALLLSCFAANAQTLATNDTAIAPSSSQTAQIDPALPEFQRSRRGVDGQIRSIGSDTLGNVMKALTTRFEKYYPGVSSQIEDKGSSTAPPALINGQAQYAPMSRPMKDSEIESFERAFGYKPTGMRIGIDCLAVFVHRENPITSLSLDQISAIFGAHASDLTWGDVGVTDPAWARERIQLYGRNSASGTYDFFKQYGMGSMDFKANVREQPGSSGVVQSVASDRFSIGYSGIAYSTAGVRTVPIMIRTPEGMRAFEPTLENASNGNYPLARFLLVYINYDESRGLDRLRREFLRFVYSRQGQEAVIEQGYFPLSAQQAFGELQKVGIEPES